MDNMLGGEKLSWMAKRMILTITIAAAVMIVGGYVFFLVNGPMEYFTGVSSNAGDLSPLSRQTTGTGFALGVALAAGLNIWKVFMLNKAAHRVTSAKSGEDEESAEKSAKSAANYIKMQYLIRFGATVAVLLAAALISFIDILGALAGILTWQIATYSLKFSKRVRQGNA
jgi:hypothetical protein